MTSRTLASLLPPATWALYVLYRKLGPCTHNFQTVFVKIRVQVVTHGFFFGHCQSNGGHHHATRMTRMHNLHPGDRQVTIFAIFLTSVRRNEMIMRMATDFI